MLFALPNLRRALLLLIGYSLVPVLADAASCITQSQIPPAERGALSTAARSLVASMQNGDTASLRAGTSPAAAADFSGIANSVEYLKPLVQGATITVDALYILDASTDAPGSPRTDFYCGTPVVVMNLTNLPPGTYALVILHATGVKQPQQISLILSKSAENRWLLGGFFDKPMTLAGHDGLWYWTAARRYAQNKMNWNAWFYYRAAANLLDPVDFLSSPNLEKLQKEEEQQLLPGKPPREMPLALDVLGAPFQVTAIETTTAFGSLDLDIHYTPAPSQAAQLQEPVAARKQVTEVASVFLKLHPELREAFHGIWAHADGIHLPVLSRSADGWHSSRTAIARRHYHPDTPRRGITRASILNHARHPFHTFAHLSLKCVFESREAYDPKVVIRHDGTNNPFQPRRMTP